MPNPYQPPRELRDHSTSDFADVATGAESQGFFRDGRFLVIDLRENRPPLRCVKTNRAVTYYQSQRIDRLAIIRHLVWAAIAILACWTHWRFFYGIGGIWGNLGTFVFIYLLFKFFYPSPVCVVIGLDDAYLTHCNRLKRTSLWMALASVLSLIALVFLEIGLGMSGVTFSPRNPTALLPLGLFILALIGAVFLAYAYSPMLRMSKERGTFTWIAGAHREFLAMLPRFPRSR